MTLCRPQNHQFAQSSSMSAFGNLSDPAMSGFLPLLGE
jgi:hypothetical protein